MSGTEKRQETERFEVHSRDLPPDLPGRAMRLISRYSVPLFLDEKLAGSGTLIKCGSIHGILTAHHVVHNPRDRTRKFDFKSGSAQRLMLGIVDIAHRFELEMRLLRCVDALINIAANKPKMIEEIIGRVNSRTDGSQASAADC